MTRSVSAHLVILPTVEVVEGYAAGLVAREGWDPQEARTFAMETMKGILDSAGWPGDFFQIARSEHVSDKNWQVAHANRLEAAR